MNHRIFNKADTNNSFFLFNRKKEIVFFNVQTLKEIKVLDADPVHGESILKLIPYRYENSFKALVDHCFTGNSITLKRSFKIGPFVSVIMQITITPVCIKSKNSYILFTIFCDTENHLLDGYSYFTSHQLRAPLSNILSLSNVFNHPKFQNFDYSKIRDLLGDINRQAKKLDNIVIALNSLLSHEPRPSVFKAREIKSVINHIVLVDDDPVTNRIHEMLISKYKNDKAVIIFNDPEKALEYVIQQIPDLLLLDLNMPGINGFRFLQELQAKDVKVDVIIVSSSIDLTERKSAYSYANVKDFLVKPLTLEKIEKILK